MKKTIGFTIVIVVAVAIIFVYFYGKCCHNKKEQGNAVLWLAAVESGDCSTALEVANFLIGCKTNLKHDKAKDEGYSQIFSENDISPKFLSAPFNKWDFELWKQAMFFDDLAKKTLVNVSSDDRKIELLLNLVLKKIKKREAPKPVVYTPYVVWQQGYGLCDKLTWVFCELAYQAGFSTQLIYLVDKPETLSSIHVFCELRKNGKVWIVDPLAEKILNGVSLLGMMKTLDISMKLWPGRIDCQQNLKNSVMLTNSFPQDYCIRNQVLQQKLHTLIDGKCPLFGEDPIERQQRYLELMRAASPSIGQALRMMLWPIPFKVLCNEFNTAP